MKQPHIANWLSNGLGGQSMFLLLLASEREIPATLSITADTGSEKDRVCSTGERMSAPEFFRRYVQPFAERTGIEAVMVRAQNKFKKELEPVEDVLRASAKRACAKGEFHFDHVVKGLSVPLFTNDKSRGRLRQSCTSKWKIAAINQEAKRRGITLLRNAVGFHAGECHRIKARYLKDDGGFSIYKPQKVTGGISKDVNWLEQYYPCIDLGLDREMIRARLQKRGLPYLVTTECDMCPHQDYARWIMHTPAVLDDAARIEAAWGGKLFLPPSAYRSCRPLRKCAKNSYRRKRKPSCPRSAVRMAHIAESKPMKPDLSNLPHGNARKLWLYDNLQCVLAWAATPGEARRLTGVGGTFIRVAHLDVPTPPHYHKPNGHLACDAIEKQPTMRDLIHALTP